MSNMLSDADIATKIKLAYHNAIDYYVRYNMESALRNIEKYRQLLGKTVEETQEDIRKEREKC